MNETTMNNDPLYLGELTDEVMDKIKNGELRPKAGQYYTYNGEIMRVYIGPDEFHKAFENSKKTCPVHHVQLPPDDPSTIFLIPENPKPVMLKLEN